MNLVGIQQLIGNQPTNLVESFPPNLVESFAVEFSWARTANGTGDEGTAI